MMFKYSDCKKKLNTILPIIIFSIVMILYILLIIYNLIYIEDKSIFMILCIGMFYLIDVVVKSLNIMKKYKYGLIILSFIIVTIFYFIVLNLIFGVLLFSFYGINL